LIIGTGTSAIVAFVASPVLVASSGLALTYRHVTIF
jgi:hypothetical protein